MKKYLVALAFASPVFVSSALAASLVNQSLLWNTGGTVNVPTGNYNFSDTSGSTVARTGTGDFEFNNGGVSQWIVGNGTVVNLAATTNRFFVGVSTGGNVVSTLNFTASSSPGCVYLQDTGNYAFRIGHQDVAINAGGIVNILGGVSFQSQANFWGQGTNTHTVNILNGSLSFMRDMTSQSGSGGNGSGGLLHDLTVVLGSEGNLFIAGLNLTDNNAFNTFLTSNGKNILLDSSLGAEYSLSYQNGATITDAVSGASINGVRINVIPEPSTYAFAGVIAAGLALVAFRRRRN